MKKHLRKRCLSVLVPNNNTFLVDALSESINYNINLLLDFVNITTGEYDI